MAGALVAVPITAVAAAAVDGGGPASSAGPAGTDVVSPAPSHRCVAPTPPSYVIVVARMAAGSGPAGARRSLSWTTQGGLPVAS